MPFTTRYYALVLTTALAVNPSLDAATQYSVSLPSVGYGWLDQYSLDTEHSYVGNEACVPTSSTNAMTYLQNFAPEVYGTALTGSSYSSWYDTANTLIGAAYMNTTSSGTEYNHIPYALDKYIRQDKGFTNTVFYGMFDPDYWGSAPYDKPSYIQNGKPTSSFLLSALGMKSATIFNITYEHGGGHELFAVGINWLDANDDGIMQFSEGAELHFVDPLDPAYYDGGYPDSGPKTTMGHLWYDSDINALLLDYDQYHGRLPYDGHYEETGPAEIGSAFAMAVPEPASGPALSGLLMLALIFVRRHRGYAV